MKNLSNLPENYISWDDSVSRVGGEEDFLVELLNDLKELVKDNLEKINNYLQNSDFQEIRELAHSIKGASGNLGLNLMYETTINLEQSAKNQDKTNIIKYLKDLEVDYNNLIVLLNN